MAPPLPEFAEPAAKPQIVDALRTLHEQSTAFWRAIDDERFFAPLGEAWSPADNVRHLDRSVAPVAQLLRLPTPVLRLLWGKVRRPSRSYAEVRERYRERLAEGVQAGRFAPPPLPAPASPREARRGLMAKRELRARALEAAIGGWEEDALDRFLLPHPALGKVTVREMLFFTVYHNLHHVANVARRLDGARWMRRRAGRPARRPGPPRNAPTRPRGASEPG